MSITGDFLAEYALENHKINIMEADKRSRLIEAALKEFAKGFSQANTDEITKNAGISKGLLFHYFGSKRGLYLFLLKNTTDMTTQEYLKVTIDSRDFLENIMKVSLKAIDLSFQYPLEFAFLSKVPASIKEVFPDQLPPAANNAVANLMMKIYQNSDLSLFRPEVDVQKACKIIIWTVKGYSDELQTRAEDMDDYKALYDKIIQELREYLQILQEALYR